VPTTPDVLDPPTHQRTNRAFRLRRRPNGPAATGDLALVTDPVAPLREGQALAGARARVDRPTVGDTSRIS